MAEVIKSLRFLSTCVLFLQYESRRIRNTEGNIWIYACRTMRMSTGRWDLSADIIWRDIGKWTEAWVGQTAIIYVRDPGKSYAINLLVVPRGYRARALHANKSRPTGSLWRKNSIKQTNVSSDEYIRSIGLQVSVDIWREYFGAIKFIDPRQKSWKREKEWEKDRKCGLKILISEMFGSLK